MYRSCRLAFAGAFLVCVAAHILVELASAEEAIQPISTNVSGTLRIAAPTVFGLRYLSPIMTSPPTGRGG